MSYFTVKKKKKKEIFPTGGGGRVHNRINRDVPYVEILRNPGLEKPYYHLPFENDMYIPPEYAELIGEYVHDYLMVPHGWSYKLNGIPSGGLIFTETTDVVHPDNPYTEGRSALLTVVYDIEGIEGKFGPYQRLGNLLNTLVWYELTYTIKINNGPIIVSVTNFDETRSQVLNTHEGSEHPFFPPFVTYTVQFKPEYSGLNTLRFERDSAHLDDLGELSVLYCLDNVHLNVIPEPD